MKKLYKMGISAALSVVLTASVLGTACGSGKKSEFNTPDYAVNALAFEDMNTYEGAVMDGGNSNQGALENGVIISPYLTCTVNGKAVDVYASRTTNGAHSFAYVDVIGEDKISLDVKLELAKSRKEVVVLPQSKGVKAKLNTRTVTAKISDTGSYSFAFDNKEDRAFTLIVKRATQPSFPEGWEVRYFEPGNLAIGDTTFTDENTVYYFKSGIYQLDGITLPSNSIMYSDYAYFNVVKTTNTSALKSNGTENVKVLGRCVFDFSGINMNTDGKHTFSFGGVKNFEFAGVTSIGSCSWTFNFNGCTGGKITNITGFAYRTYTDGIMIANSKNMRVSDSFMRTGDDAFEVKSTGSGLSSDIVFSDCHAWNDKAVAFGVIYEMNYPVEDVTFIDCSVGFNMPVWDVTRAAASVCMCDYEMALTNKNITFENFEVYYSLAPIITLCLHSGTLENIQFKNFSLAKNYAEDPVYIKFNATYLSGNKPTDKRICRIRSVYFENITIESDALTADMIYGVNLPDELYINGTKYAR